MKREVWQKVYEPREELLSVRVEHTLHALNERAAKPMNGKRMLALALSAALALACTVAGAAGILFPNSYDAVRLANRALAEEYGITEEMQTYFTRTVEEENGVTLVVFNGLEDMQHVLGQYTVILRDGEATVTWSKDGQSTEGGLDAYAWGAKQIEILLDMAKEEQGFSRGHQKAKELLTEMQAQSATASTTRSHDETSMTQTDESMDMTLISISEEEAIAIAKRAFAAEYGLTQTQLEQMQYEKDYAGYTYAVVKGTTICEVWFWLHQQEDVYHTAGDGLYWARINAQTGVVEDMDYDSALAGNG